jgi:hypothetical protein
MCAYVMCTHSNGDSLGFTVCSTVPDNLLEHIYRLNKVTVNVNGKNDTAVKKKTYDLNTKIDLFFTQYAGWCSFP